mgnify:CR=1 FL=1
MEFSKEVECDVCEVVFETWLERGVHWSSGDHPRHVYYEADVLCPAGHTNHIDGIEEDVL